MEACWPDVLSTVERGGAGANPPFDVAAAECQGEFACRSIGGEGATLGPRAL